MRPINAVDIFSSAASLLQEEVRAYRPLVTSIVDEVARTRDKQGRISDYSAMFTQATNVWRMSEALRLCTTIRQDCCGSHGSQGR
jgi:hypothetical protein